MAQGVLPDSAAALMDSGGAELDDVEGVKDRDGVLDGLGRDVVPDVFVDAQAGDGPERAGSAAIACSSGSTKRHTVRKIVLS